MLADVSAIETFEWEWRVQYYGELLGCSRVIVYWFCVVSIG